MKKVFLINLSYGIAGTEKRFLNIWKVLKLRGNVSPILVIPDTQALLFHEAGMLDIQDKDLYIIHENIIVRKLFKARFNNNTLNDIVTIIRSRFMAIGYQRAWKMIRKEKDAVIHMGMKCSALFPPDFPIVYECVDSTLSEFRRGHFKRASRKKSVINCQTDRIKTALTSAYKDEKTTWITVTSPSYFADYSSGNDQAVVKDEKLVLFVGRMAQEKNPELLIHAVNEMNKAGTQVKVSMFGEGPLAQKVKSAIADLNLDDIIETGFTKTPQHYLSKAAIFVSLQSGDNYGSQSLLEAMNSGCAVVATNAGETKRIINESNGILVGFNKNELADALTRLVNDPSHTAALGRNGKALVKSEYTADSYASYLEKLYEQAEHFFITKIKTNTNNQYAKSLKT